MLCNDILTFVLIISEKIGRKWHNIEIEIPISRGGGGAGRGAIRMPSAAMNTNHHSNSSSSNAGYSSTAPSTISRGGMGSNRRSGLPSNGSFNRGRGGRSVNGYYQPRSSLRAPDSEAPQDTVNDGADNNNSESRAVPQAAPGFVGGPPRGTFSRGRRSGPPGGRGYANPNYIPRSTVPSVQQSTSSASITVSQQAPVAAAAATAVSAQTMSPISPVGQGPYSPSMMIFTFFLIAS